MNVLPARLPMLLPPLLPGRLIRRYKRFFADIELLDGTTVCAHTPNTGSMQQCAIPGFRVWISEADNPARKLRYTLELIEVNGYPVDVNTQRSNRVVEEGLRNGFLPDIDPASVRPEYRYRDSRIDFYAETKGVPTLIEVKNVTLCTDGTAQFPDAPTERGRKHLNTLADACTEDYRSVILYLIQRPEALRFSAAAHIDPAYAKALSAAVTAGVKPLALTTFCDLISISLHQSIPVETPPLT